MASSFGIDHMVTGTTMQGPPQHFEVSPCLKAGAPHFVCYCIQGDIARGARFGQNGKGFSDEQVCYTLNTMDVHVVAFREGSFAQFAQSDQAGTLKASGGVAGGGFRDSYLCNSNGKNLAGPLCARDYKGVSGEYVDEGKVICLERL